MFGPVKFVLHNCCASLLKNDHVVHESFRYTAFEDILLEKYVDKGGYIKGNLKCAMPL